ncbi:hypothetical protein NIES2100_44580 [Calothrix sp. NIES-2100]|nr:hypothetical protein NIES2100_44580 [Calothrix sp. NIES-2100]
MCFRREYLTEPAPTDGLQSTVNGQQLTVNRQQLEAE